MIYQLQSASSWEQVWAVSCLYKNQLQHEEQGLKNSAREAHMQCTVQGKQHEAIIVEAGI